MSICYETNAVTNAMAADGDDNSSASSSIDETTLSIQQPPPSSSVTVIQQTTNNNNVEQSSVRKMVTTNSNIGFPKTSLITVLNTPLTNVKTLCVAPQTVVNSSSPLAVTNPVVKPQTITLINAPVTVMKTISPNVEKNVDITTGGAINNPTTDMPQSHKLLTANNFPSSGVQKTLNGQRNKVKIVSNVMLPTSTNPNLIVNKTTTSIGQRYVPQRQKFVGQSNMKFVNSNKATVTTTTTTTSGNLLKTASFKTEKRVLYPTHKSQLKTMPPMNNYTSLQKATGGIRTLPAKNVVTQLSRNMVGANVRTLTPQRPPKIINKPNYIGKHAVQAQKMPRHPKMKTNKNILPPTSTMNYGSNERQQSQPHMMTFNQVLTAEILETLSNNKTTTQSMLPSARYDNYYHYNDDNRNGKSGLDTLSLICQAVLLDHNYNATLPPDVSPTVNGTPNTSTIKRRPQLPPPSPQQSAMQPITMNNVPSITIGANSVQALNNGVLNDDDDDDDATSDISDGKIDTEGEETDTAPEAEAEVVGGNEDHYGDYVTRCICGYLHDDGYMIECDRCKVWQHVQCVVKNRQVPEEYLCEVCDPTKHVDRHKAHLVQQQWLRDRQFMRKDGGTMLTPSSLPMTKLPPKDNTSDTDSSDGEMTQHHHHSHPHNVGGRTRTNLVQQRRGGNSRQRRDSKEIRRTTKKTNNNEKRRMTKRKTKLQTKISDDDENCDGNTATPIPQLRHWIENYEEAVTNHYSPELRARISSIRVNNGTVNAHTDMSTLNYDPTIIRCRVHTQPLTDIRYLMSTVKMVPNTPVVELRGKYMLSTQHRNNIGSGGGNSGGGGVNGVGGGNAATRLHAQRPGPFLFFYRLHKDNTEVCVDTRTYGNSARFIRRSCKPNAELRHCIEKGVLHLYIVTITDVDKNCELTIKHESHDLAAIGTTHIACACDNLDECTVNKLTNVKRNNGESNEIYRKRRGRRVTSITTSNDTDLESTISTQIKTKEEIIAHQRSLSSPPIVVVKQENDIKPEEVKKEVLDEKVPVEIKEEIKIEETKLEEADGKIVTKTVTARRASSHGRSEKDECVKEESKEDMKKNKKLSREERKLEAILRAIAQMEKADQKKQEHQAKQAHRKESTDSSHAKESDDKNEPKMKRKRRKGRTRTLSSHNRNRLNSTDSYMTSGDENLLSPTENSHTDTPISKSTMTSDKEADLLLALSNGDGKLEKSSLPCDVDSNSNSTQSSPETQLSSACLLVQAAVEPMEVGGFKFPKTKKGLMNEWLNKVPENGSGGVTVNNMNTNQTNATSPDYDGNMSFYGAAGGKNLAALAQVASFCGENSELQQARGSAKKRWLMQAIRDDQCDSPSGNPESPPLSETVAPPKKRRLPRESISNDITPPTTPTNLVPPVNNLETTPVSTSDLVYSQVEDEQLTPTPKVIQDDVVDMIESDTKCDESPTTTTPINLRQESANNVTSSGCSMDPRLTRSEHHHIFTNNDLVGTVEKTLSIFGFEDRKPEPIKRKLSITEYRQRKKLNVNEKNAEEISSIEENNSSSESFKPVRTRSDSTSSSCTSMSSSDDDCTTASDHPVEKIIVNKPSAFNSEPTELERQRELTTLRLKKTFGIRIPADETRKPAIDVETIINCELPPVVRTNLLPSPNFPIPGSCDVALASNTIIHPENEGVNEVILNESVENHVDEKVIENDDVKKRIDENELEEEIEAEDEEEEVCYEEVDTSIDYVPPFNNPIYPNDSSFATYTSVIDDEGRYEGRNPSPPPDLEVGVASDDVTAVTNNTVASFDPQT